MKHRIQSVWQKVRVLSNRLCRTRINRRNRKRLNNRDVTVISSNCNGGWMLHDLGLRFNSPFVNLFICADDYIRLLQNFAYYMEQELTFVEEDCGYPVAMLGDVRLHCVHYTDAQEVRDKWKARKARMDPNNMYVLFTDRDGCTRQHLEAFESLPFRHKVVFTHRPYADLPSAVYVPGFEEQGYVGELHRYVGWKGIRHYDVLDYTDWFNQSVSHPK